MIPMVQGLLVEPKGDRPAQDQGFVMGGPIGQAVGWFFRGSVIGRSKKVYF